jgi:hypothetical protein
LGAILGRTELRLRSDFDSGAEMSDIGIIEVCVGAAPGGSA